MGMSINTNNAALTASYNLQRSSAAYGEATQRLSSGMRINSAKDDAAGLAIASKMDSQIRGMNVAMRNANDGISLGQTAESYLGTIQESMQRMREIGVQAQNGTLTTADQGQLDKEFQQLTQEITRTVNDANFNGVKLFDGSTATMNFQIGAGTTANDQISVNNVDLTALNTVGGLDVTSAANAKAAVTALDADLATVVGQRSVFGAVQSRFESVVNNLSAATTNLQAAKGRIMDADFAQETMKMTRSNILQQAGTTMLSQTNQTPNNVLQLLR